MKFLLRARLAWVEARANLHRAWCLNLDCRCWWER